MADETVEPTPELADSSPAVPDITTQRILLVSYPKIVFMYPSAIVALLCGLYMAFSGATIEDPGSAHLVARFFILVLTVNLVVIAFDFPRTTSLTLFFLSLIHI